VNCLFNIVYVNFGYKNYSKDIFYYIQNQEKKKRRPGSGKEKGDKLDKGLKV
jgi:hypothetical protein